MPNRDRAQGWQHAKRSGHENERLVAELTGKNAEIRQRLLRCAHLCNVTIESVEYGGIRETDVDCILGGKTKSKTDMWLCLSNGEKLNVSIKKERGGQVFLIGIDRFTDGFEKQYRKAIPACVKRAISLYFGSAEDTINIVNAFGGVNRNLEIRKHRLTADTLRAYDENLYVCLLQWFNDNVSELFDFCFARGLAADPQDWAQIVWYKNSVGENQLDDMIYLPDFQKRVPPTAGYGVKNGGSTIQLPFGFVQWHSPGRSIPGKLQFHHNYDKIASLL